MSTPVIPESNSCAVPGLIGESTAIQEVARLIHRVAPTSATVLLLGETGTGKELAARAIHQFSSRASGPFIRVNCGALSESLLESELFGHVKGAFTNALENRTGRFEAAHGGTIFLDEINSTTPHLQVRLLRVLQEQEFERVGDTRTIRVDCRFIAATNRDLLEEIQSGRFREDLYYRLNVVPLYLPPLRERPEDIPLLARYFLERYSQQNRRPTPQLSEEAIEALKHYAWPGNVRELQNYMERAIVLCQGDVITVDLLPSHVRGLAPLRLGRPQPKSRELLCRELVTLGLIEAGEDAQNLHELVMSMVERELILQVLRSCQGIQTKAAQRLGINRNTLHKKIEDYHLGHEVR